MTPLDLTLLTALAGFVLAGFWFGAIHMIGAVVGAIAGVFISGYLAEPVGGLIAPIFGGNQNLAQTVSLVIIFLLVMRAVGLLFNLVEHIFNVLAIIPFLRTFNRLIGAALGLIEGLLVLGVAVHFASKFPISDFIRTALQESVIAAALNIIGLILTPLLPHAIRAATSIL